MFAFHRAMANSNDFYFGDAASDVEGNDDDGIENEHKSDASDSWSGEETDVEGSDESGEAELHNEEDSGNTEEWTKGTGNSNEKSRKGQATEVFVGIVVGIVNAVL